MIAQFLPRRAAAAAATLGLALFGFGHGATGATASQTVVSDAEVTMSAMLEDPRFPNITEVVSASHGVLIVPSLTRGGIGMGGEGGTGVLLTRTDDGWSNPVFVDLAGISIGLQIGVETVDAVMAVQDKATLDAILNSGIKLGADASVVAGDRGRRTEAAASHDARGDIALFSRSQGVFAGAALKGVRMVADDAMNAEFYGRPVSVGDILDGRADTQAAASLRAAMPGGS